MQISKIVEEQKELFEVDYKKLVDLQYLNNPCEKCNNQFCQCTVNHLKNFLLSSHLAVLEAELERKKNIKMGKCNEKGVDLITQYVDGYNASIQEDITYLEQEITKIKEL
jgi:hypothetical protein